LSLNCPSSFSLSFCTCRSTVRSYSLLRAAADFSRPSMYFGYSFANFQNVKDFYNYFERGCRKNCARDNPKGNMGYDQYTCSWHCSSRTYFCCFPLALANKRPWPFLPFFEISLKNSELKTTHNNFRDCRVHLYRQPFSK